MKILVIVDMQPRFPASRNPELIEKIVGLIQSFKDQQWPIIVLEYVLQPGTMLGGVVITQHDQKTHRAIRSALEKYDRCAWETKEYDDGSSEVIRIVNRRSWHHIKQYVLCGVNTSCCVRSTAQGLADKSRAVEVYLPACNDYWCPDAVFPNRDNLIWKAA